MKMLHLSALKLAQVVLARNALLECPASHTLHARNKAHFIVEHHGTTLRRVVSFHAHQVLMRNVLPTLNVTRTQHVMIPDRSCAELISKMLHLPVTHRVHQEAPKSAHHPCHAIFTQHVHHLLTLRALPRLPLLHTYLVTLFSAENHFWKLLPSVLIHALHVWIQNALMVNNAMEIHLALTGKHIIVVRIWTKHRQYVNIHALRVIAPIVHSV
jgi:hypothetical protein